MATVQLAQWSIYPVRQGFVAQGQRHDGSEKYDFHTAPIDKAGLKGTELYDTENNKVVLVGSADEAEMKLIGFSENFRKEHSTADAMAKPSIFKDIAKEGNNITARKEVSQLNWRDLPFIGVEIKSIADIYAEQYEFPDFYKQMTEGALWNLGRPVYVFLGAQPVYIGDTVKNMPYLVAVDCKIPPPSLLAHHSLQAGKEEIIEMKNTKVEWAPYIPKAARGNRILETLPITIYALGWKERSSSIRNFDEEKMHWHEYLLPYIALPQLVEKEEFKDVTQVSFDFKYEGKEYPIIFDKEIDRLATFIPDWLEENKLHEAASEKVKDAIKAAFQEKRAKERAQFDEQQARVKDLTPEARQALKDIRIVKFYPTHPTLDIKAFVDPKVNAYYGNATQVLVPDRPAPLPEPIAEEGNKKRKGDTPRKNASVGVSPRSRSKRAHTETEIAPTSTPVAPAPAAAAPAAAESASESVDGDEKPKKRGRTASPRRVSSGAGSTPKRGSSRLAKGKSAAELDAAPPLLTAPTTIITALPASLLVPVPETALASVSVAAAAPAAAEPAQMAVSFGVGCAPVAVAPIAALASTAATPATNASSSVFFGASQASATATPISFGVTGSAPSLPATLSAGTGSSFSFDAAPAAASTAPAFAGFVFGAGTAPVAAPAAPSATWRCQCCETHNALTATACSVCMVPRPTK